MIKEPEKYFKEVCAPAPMEDEQDYVQFNEVRRRSTIQVLEYAKSLDAYNQFGKEDIDKDIAWLEKQGKQILDNSAKTCKDEPKFKVGDWVVYTGYLLKYSGKEIHVMQVASVEDDRYNFTDTSTLCFDSEKDMKLWTIQDAKDGDVLALSYASSNYILIYKRLYENGESIMSVYCFYCVEEDTYHDRTDSFHVMNRGEIITPATKEQRDLLFKVMTDEGWEFDFEKKELKWILSNKENTEHTVNVKSSVGE